MIKNYFYRFTFKFQVLSLLIIISAGVHAQSTAIISTGTAGTPQYNAGPIYRSSTTSSYNGSRYTYLYTASELMAAGIVPNSTITSLGWVKNNTAIANYPLAIKIYLRNTSTAAFSAASETWTNLISGATLVHQNAAFSVPTTSYPNYITFALSAPFTYTGGSLEVSFEQEMVGGASPYTSGVFDWMWSTVVDRIYGTGNTNLAGITSMSSTTNTISTIDDRRPYIQISFIASTGYDNASVAAITSPTTFCGSSQPVKARIKNVGKNKLDSVTVNWDIDAVPQTQLVFRSTLDTISGTGVSDTVLTLGNITFSSNAIRTLRVWTSLPNGIADTVTGNDSMTVVLREGLSGTYSIHPSSTDFTSIGAAVNAMSQYGVCGPVTFNVDAGTTYTENPILITRSGTATNFIRFQKNGSGANPIVYGRNGAGALDAVIALAGVNYVTFDGIDVMDSSSNATATTQMEFGYGIVNITVGTDVIGSSNNTIKNCKVTLKRTNTATIGIAQSTLTAAGSLQAGNHNNRYENVRVENSYNGILLQGTPAFPDSNNVITSSGTDTTVIGATSANDIGNGTAIVYGIQAAEQKNVEISKSVVRNLTHSSTLLPAGIWINNGSTTSNYGKAKVFGNILYNLNRITTTTATGAMHGIKIDVSINASAVVYNNLVYNISSSATPASANAIQCVRGMSHGSVTGTGNSEFYNNTVSVNSSGANGSSSAFWKAGTGTVTLKNNIFSNTSPAQTGVAKHYAVFLSAGTITASNNLLWTANANGFPGFATSDRTTLQQWAAAISNAAPANMNEAGSAYANPNFTSVTNFTFAGATPAALSGMPITNPALTTDILGNARSSSQPTIGAYETSQALIDSSAPVIENVITISGTTPTVYATITDNSGATAAGNVQLWYRIGSSGAFTPVAPDSIPSGSLNGTYKWGASLSSLTVGTYQYYIAARDITGPGLNIGMNPIYGVSVAGFATSDPANFISNPDAAANTRTLIKSSSLAGGTYSVGPSGTYANLSIIANLLNASVVTGNIIFELQHAYDGTTAETFPITFNDFLTSGGNWTVTIRPASGATARETSGYPASGVPIINLNGTRRITFDGRPGGAGSTSEWTIRSKRTSGSSNSPCILFINGAQRDTVRYMKLESGNTTATSGTVLFSTTGSVGNSSNMIANCIIRDRSDSAEIHAAGVYSAGTAGNTNDSNMIVNNNILNFATNGIAVTATGNGGGWVITGNSLYNNLSTPPATAQTCISFIPGTASGGNRINGNFIGGSTPACGGAAFTNTGNIAWRGMTCSTSQADSSFIQNNTIQNVNLSGTGSGTYASIEVTGGLWSIRGNTIGHATTPNSIQSAQLGTIISIWMNNAGNTAQIYDNTIANITSLGNTTAVGHNGIRIATGVTTNPLVIRNNTVHHLSSDNPTVSSSTSSVVGILSLYAGTQQSIHNNTVYDLKTTGGPANAATTAIGINASNASGVGAISGNRIYNISNVSPNSGSQAIGIHLDLASAWTIVNNMISIGANVDSSAIITGIQDKSAGVNNAVYYNSVVISGSALSPAATVSQAYRRTTTAATNVRNNIFVNTRTSGSANYAIANTNATPATGWKANYNDLYTGNTAQLGLWNTTPTDFATWKTTSLHDTSSVNILPVFVGSTDLHLTGASLGNMSLAGRPVAGITTDFDGQTRQASFPYMGADESITNPLPVELLNLSARKIKNEVLLSWATASEKNSAWFEVEKNSDVSNESWENIGNVTAAGNSTIVNHYDLLDKSPFTHSSTVYYRLKIVDSDGSFAYSKVVSVSEQAGQAENIGLSVYPNPFSSEVYVTFVSETATHAVVEVTDISGKTVAAFTPEVTKGNNVIPVYVMEKLDAGIYFMTVNTGNQKQTTKLIKH